MSQQPVFYPLTQSQKMVFLSLKFSYIKSVANICIMMHFKDDVDELLLMQATYLTILRNHSASIRLRKFKETDENGRNKKVVKQYFSKQAPNKIEVVDFSDSTEEIMADAVDTWSRTAFSNGSMDTQLYRIILVHKPDGHYALYFCVNHCIFDAYSLMANAKDLLSIYVALRDGGALPKPMSSPLPAYEADWKYDISEHKTKDLEFWEKELYDEEPFFTSFAGRDSSYVCKGKRFGHSLKIWQIKANQENLIIKKKLVDKVDDFAASRRISPQVLYLLALRNYLSMKNDYVEDVLFCNTVARRATIHQKRAGGTMVQAIQFRTQISNDTTFENACLIMQGLQSKYYRHSNSSMTEVFDIATRKLGVKSGFSYHTVSVTYQPYFVTTEPTVPVYFTRHSNGASSLPLYITIMAMDDSGDLTCNYEYTIKFTDPQQIRLYHEYMLNMLEKATEYPQMTLSELMK